MIEITQQALLAIIINTCGMTKSNFDSARVTHCMDLMVNCSVKDDGKIYRKVVDECVKEIIK